MKLDRIVYFLLTLFVVSVLSQDPTTTSKPEWNGDPAVCVPDDTPSPGGSKPYPIFPKKAEFTLEFLQVGHLQNNATPTILNKLQYLYDSDANLLILIRNTGDIVDIEYFYYNNLKRSVYFRGEYCAVTDIPVDVENDGNSAIIGPDGKPRIRPMNEFLLFSRNDTRKPLITPKFHGQAIVRGITADKWETCIVDKINRITEKRTWYFAAAGQSVPSTGLIRDEAVPLQAEIKRSIDDQNGTQILEIDSMFNVHTFRPGFIETVDQLAPPKGVFCSTGPDQVLGSLEDVKINWPERFSVRVDVSSSRSPQWQRFHLRYDRREGGNRILRYDFLPVGSEDYRSIIHDYSQNATYVIDLRTGGCRARENLFLRDVDPIRDPIDFFIKNEDIFILNRTDRIWEYNGIRSCRGSTIECSVITAQKKNFPLIIEPDTGRPTGETWGAMSMEYAWSVRAPLVPDVNPNRPRGFDYPAHLYLRFYRNDPSTLPIGGYDRNEDLEYEFFEMSGDVSSADFDLSTCYRANNYDYLHLGFIFTFNNGALNNENAIDRRSLQREVTRTLGRVMGISISRISGIEIDHELVSNNVTVFFTLLGKIPDIPSNEPNIDQARESLSRSIDNGEFKVNIRLTEGSSTELVFTAAGGSLKSSKQFMSIHSTGQSIVEEEYSSSAEATAIIVGLLVGLLIGIIIAVAFRVIRKEPVVLLPGNRTSISNPIPSIRFQNTRKTAEETKTAGSEA